MIRVEQEYFNIGQIAASGQCFRMNASSGRDGSVFDIIAGGRFVKVTAEESAVCFDCTEEEFSSFWKDYFDLGTDYGAFIKAVDPRDEYLRSAAACGSGIRILKQDPWEMIISFLISQQNNITRIKRCIDNISRKYGKKTVHTDGTVYYSFPEPEPLAALPEDALMECNLGYRSKYVVRTARDVCEGRFVPEETVGLPYEEAREKLLKLYGVGAKVADCICLFGLHMLEAFPVDTHIKQVLEREYKAGFPFERYRGFEGVIQQYIFYYELMNGVRK